MSEKAKTGTMCAPAHAVSGPGFPHKATFALPLFDFAREHCEGFFQQDRLLLAQRDSAQSDADR